MNGNLITIGVGDMAVSDNPFYTLVTYSLGSCLGIVVHDPVVKVGGILHAMLPEAKDEKENKNFNPYKYIDAGVPLFFKETYKYGAKKNRMIISVLGGSRILDESGFFNIGKRNLATLRKMFWKNGVMVDKEHVEGNVSRTVRLDIATGEVRLRLGYGEELIL